MFIVIFNRFYRFLPENYEKDCVKKRFMITSCNLNCSYRYLFSRIPFTQIKQGSFSDSE